MVAVRLSFILGILFGPVAAFAQAEAVDDTPSVEVADSDSGETEEAEEAEAEVAEVASPLVVGPGSELLMQENAGRAKTNRIGGFVLGGWALGNFTWATIGLVGEPEDRERAFHLTNAAVNLVVAGVAVGTYFANVPDESWDEFGVIETLNEAHGTEKLYLLATGLDVAYFMTGAFLTAKGNVAPVNEGMIGAGRSLMLQGAFLFAFDATMFTLHMLRRSKFVRELVGAH